jgi:anaphase-promoting complex subunit 8
VRPIQDYAKSCIYVARHQLHAPDGDLFLAREYLERVASSNAEEVAMAADLLKKVKIAIQEKAQTEAEGLDNAKHDDSTLPTNTKEDPFYVATAVGGTGEAAMSQ